MHARVCMLEKLAKQTAIYGISTILGRMLSYLLTPFYTRIFTQSTYGIITDVYALIPFALVVLTLGMESGYFRFAAKAEEAGGDTEAAKRRLYATTWGITSLAALIFFAFIFLFRDSVSGLMGEAYAQHPMYTVTVAAIIMMDVMGCIPFSRLRERGEAGRFVILKLMNIVLQVALAFIFWGVGLFDTDFGVGWAFVANLAASVITTVAVTSAAHTLPRIDPHLLGRVAVYSMPLLISGIAGTAGEFLDRQLIKYLIPLGSMAQLGIYGAITKIAVVMTLFTQMYRLAAEPFFLSSFRKEEFKEMNAAALKYFVLASMLIFLGITLFKDVFALIVGADFREGMHILPTVLFANVLSGVWLNLSFWYKREEKTIYALWVTLTGVACSVACCIFLIPRLGYEGAAWSRFAAEAAMVAASIALNRIHYPTPYSFLRIGEYIAAALAVFAFSEIFTPGNAVLRYMENSLLFLAYLAYTVRRERIDMKSLIRSAVRRR